MIYGDEKLRQMARSILPSTWGAAAALKRAIHKSERMRSKKTLRAAISSLDEDGEILDDGDYAWCNKSARQRLVADRRGADKLNHFVTWAEHVTADMPVEDRIPHLRKMLPKGVIGNHAVSHLWGDHFVLKHTRYMPPVEKWVPEKLPDWATLLDDIVSHPKAHQALNKALRASHKTNVWVDYNVDPTEVYPDAVVIDIEQARAALRRRISWSGGYEVGPTQARTLKSRKDIPTFIEDIEAARRNPTVPCRYMDRSTRHIRWLYGNRTRENTPTYTSEYVVTRKKRPGHHPEWGWALSRFLTEYNKNPASFW